MAVGIVVECDAEFFSGLDAKGEGIHPRELETAGGDRGFRGDPLR